MGYWSSWIRCSSIERANEAIEGGVMQPLALVTDTDERSAQGRLRNRRAA